MKINVYQNDLPDDVFSYFKNEKINTPQDEKPAYTDVLKNLKIETAQMSGSAAPIIAVDTEAMGLMPYRDRLCLAQLSNGDGEAHLVQFTNYDKADNLKKLLADESITKVFHYARFDVMMMYKYLGVMTKNIYCTKIVSRLVRTYSNRHSLQELCFELLGFTLSKEQTSTDWGKKDLTKAQKEYAANDVLYLHKIKDKLDIMLEREKRTDIAKECFRFLETRVIIDLLTDESYDIFAHHMK